MDKSIVRALLLLCSVGLSAFNLSSQTITGSVIDNDGNPVEFANVVLLNPNDSTYLQGAVSGINGEFSIPSANAGLLKVSCLGFEDRYLNGANGNVGQIVLSSSGIRLSEVEVKTSRIATKINDDALVTLIEGTPFAKAGTGADVLGKVPGVVKTGEDIEVIGKGKPLIYINGRLMRNESELDQLASSQIKDVEVITTPGARYDSSVNSVIRINTVKPVGEGFGFDSRTMVGTTSYVYGLEEINFNYRNGKFDLFGMLEYENNRSREAIDLWQDVHSKTFIQQVSNTHRKTSLQEYAGKLGFNYAFNERNSIGLQYDFSYLPSDVDNNSYTSMSTNRVLENELISNGTSAKQDRRHILNAYYFGAFGAWQLDVNMDGMWTIQDDRQYVDETATASDNRLFGSKNDVDNRLLAIKAVASKDLWKGNISFGTEWSFVDRNDLYDSGEDFISDSDTKIKERNGALFVEATQKFGKLTAIAGLRYEHVGSDYYDGGVKSKEQSRKYDNLFPSLMLLYPIKNLRTRLSYSRKVTRPAYNQLNSNVQYVNRYTYQSGNPYLQPSYRDYVSLSANWKWLTMAVDFTHVSNYIMSVYTQYKDNPEIALLQKQNAKAYNEIQAMLNFSPSFGIYNPTLMLAVRKQFYDVMFCNEKLKLDNPMGIVRFNNAINIPGDIWINADFSYRTEGNAENLYLKDSWQFDLGVYKSFKNDMVSVKLQCNDLFDTARTSLTMYSDIRKLTMDKMPDTRNISLTVGFKFNSAKSKYKGTGAGESEKNRL